MTRTSEVSPIFAFSLTKGSAPAVKSNLPTSGNGFLSISTAIEVVPGTLLVISIGTTAPFSAICGASISTSLLGRGLPAPNAFSASAAVFAPKPSLFQAAASATNGFSQAAARSATRLLRSEEHTSELQSRLHLVCRLLLEKKKLTLNLGAGGGNGPGGLLKTKDGRKTWRCTN